MVDYKNGELRQIIPVNLLTPEVMAISYAVEMEKRKLLKHTAGTSLYAAINEVPESVLDLMALELNAQYYEQSLPRKVKEQLVQQTLLWYMRAGTPSVLTEFLKTIMEGGYIEEWNQYGGEPYFFKAYARADENTEIPLGYGEDVKQRINIYKNVRSWLERFSFVIGTKFLVKVRAENCVKLQMSFFSRDNQPFSLLSGDWKLNGKRYLNGYECEKLVDFYPIQLWILSRSRVKPLFTNGIRIRAGDARLGTDYRLSVRLQGKGHALTEVGMIAKMKAAVRCDSGSVSYMTKMNRMDSAWRLDGSRKLDGGRYIL